MLPNTFGNQKWLFIHLMPNRSAHNSAQTAIADPTLQLYNLGQTKTKSMHVSWRYITFFYLYYIDYS